MMGLSLTLTGCGSTNAAGEKINGQDGVTAQAQNQTAEDPSADGQTTVPIDDQAVPLYNKPSEGLVLTPEADGTTVYGNDTVTIDASNTNQGYIMLKYKGSNDKIKVQINKSGGTLYTYDLNARNAYEVFPLTEGDGTYSVKVFEHLTGNEYSQVCSQSIDVKLANQFLPFLYPNQHVNFTAGSQAVKTGMEITKDAKSDVESIQIIYNYVINNITYDREKAQNVQSGYLPDVDKTLSERKGICFDYAALMATMLRTQNIPAKLVVGYSGDVYHAWINVYVEGQGWIDGMIFFNGSDWELMDPTFASTGKQSESIMKYIGDSSNYTAEYAY